MTECGFLLPVEQDTMDIRLFEQIRDLHFCDEELQWELIPMRRFTSCPSKSWDLLQNVAFVEHVDDPLVFRVMGRVYPPEDIWREPDLPSSSKANKVSSASKKKKGPKKADSARRLKVTSWHWRNLLTKFVLRCQGIPREAYWMTTWRMGGRRRIKGKRVLGSLRVKRQLVWMWKRVDGKKTNNVLCSSNSKLSCM